MVGGHWQLVSRAGDPAALLDADDAAWFRRIGGTLSEVSPTGPVFDVDGTYQQWFTRHGCDVFLSRPDFYVFGAGDAADAPALVSSLRSMLEPATSEGDRP